jgi:glycerol-3-phosphate O-acyltransferase/dihydroxyacetone phosphate acyltransferase
LSIYYNPGAEHAFGPARSWAKSTIFINAPVSALLTSAGNISVDRKNKDNQKLFAGTFEALKLGEAVAIFPEGTSYTEPRLQEIKDGASWVSWTAFTKGKSRNDTYSCSLYFVRIIQAILEYSKNLRSDTAAQQSGSKDATVVVASIVYTKKTSYRTRAIMRFSKRIDTQPYIERFLDGSDPEGPKKAVKALTKEIRDQMEAMTVNAPDW